MPPHSVKEYLLNPSDQKATKPESVFTKILWNRPPTEMEGNLILFIVFMVVGITPGYLNTQILELQEKGASYNDQALFSITFYPLIFKIVFAPLLDGFYSKTLGKCKTWIVSCLFCKSLSFGVVATMTQTLLTPSKIPVLVSIWFTIHIFSGLLSIAIENYLVKLFYHDATKKGKGGLIICAGFAAGFFIGYNLFIALADWKLITHASFSYTISIGVFILGVYILVWVAEESTEDEIQKPDLFRIIRILPEFVKQPNTRMLLMFIILTRVFNSMFAEVLILKFIRSGIAKSTIVYLDTISTPLIFLATYISFKKMKEGSIAYTYGLIMMFLNTVVVVFGFLALLDLQIFGNKSRAVFLLLLRCMLTKLALESSWYSGFVTSVTPGYISSTFITAMYSVGNLCEHIPNSIGLKLAAIFFSISHSLSGLR